MRRQKKIDPKMKIVNKNQVKDINNESSVFKTPSKVNQIQVAGNQVQQANETKQQAPQQVETKQEISQIQPKPKKKRKMSQKQLENLKRGREVSLKNRQEKRRLKEIEYAERNGIPIEKVKKTWTEKQIEKKYKAMARKEKLAKYNAQVEDPIPTPKVEAKTVQNQFSFTPELFNKYMNDWVANEQKKEQSRRKKAPKPVRKQALPQASQNPSPYNPNLPVSNQSNYRYSTPFQGLSKSQQANRGRYNGSSWGL